MIGDLQPATMIPLGETKQGPDARFVGTIKEQIEDFIVEEIPAYEPMGGDGEHLFLWVEKRDLSAEQLMQQFSRTLRLRREDIGMAGLKDKKGITRQYISVPKLVSPSVPELNNEQVTILKSMVHRNKLKTGHLLGNRFDILIRTSDPEAPAKAERVAQMIRDFGVPNYYGEQRFGKDNETLILGYRLLTGDANVKEIPFERRRFLLRLALSSVQSDLFNRILLERLQSDELHRVLDGDVMQKLDSGGVFTDDNTELLQRRFETREIVMTGPMYGPKMFQPKTVVLEKEQALLDRMQIKRELFQEYRVTPGTRRGLLMYPGELEIEPQSAGIRVRFSLPSGSYATIVLAEFAKQIDIIPSLLP
ncbi:tRNA pseudouridine(13) synthase TruD [Lacunimicrobium album]